MTHHLTKYMHVLIPFYLVSGFAFFAVAQTPLITVRLANPQNDCVTGEYCLDVEFTSDMSATEVFGMNVRFFYDDDVLELVDFRDFQGGYGPVAPNPPIITTSTPAGPALFNFAGPAEFVNGAMQLVSSGSPPILLAPGSWTKLYQICFLLDDPNANLDTFCPSVVWDLEQDPANGGFLSGDDGVVVTVVDPDPNNESLPANEAVEQFNWQYTGNGTPPYGQPFDLVCSNVNCALPIRLLSFLGKLDGANVQLEWTTTDELYFQGFQVQRTSDLIAWNTLADIAYQASNSTTSVYHYTDRNPVKGRNYYRLMLLDHDGRSTYSTVIIVDNEGLNSSLDFQIVPNPAVDGYIDVRFLSPCNEVLFYQLTDGTGTLVRNGSVQDCGMKLDVQDLPAGVYSLSLKTPKSVFSKRVILQ